MAKGRDRPGKEKRKPKAEKNKVEKKPMPGMTATPSAPLNIGTNPPAKKT
jgi:hypothetical protein